MINLKDAAEVVIPVLTLAGLLLAVSLDFKRRLRAAGKKFKSRR